MLHNKKSQVGETITWVVATLIIFVILSVSIYSASLLARSSRVMSFADLPDSANGLSEILSKESLFAYLQTKNSNGQTINEQMSNDRRLNNFENELATKIFRGVFGSDVVFLLNERTNAGNFARHENVFQKILIDKNLRFEIYKQISKPTVTI
ncbi:MAG: hypothetical protein ABIH49_01450 [archaeon]